MPAENREFAVVRGGATPSTVSPSAPPSAPEEGGALAYLLDAAWEGRRLVVAALAVAVLGLAGYLLLVKPTYESDVLIQIEQRRQGGQALSDLTAILGGPQSQADTEIEVLQSRLVLGSVVDGLGLDLLATPRRLPVIGAAWARRHAGPAPAAAPWGFSRFAWGGEALSVSRVEVPATPEGDAPWSLRLVAGADGAFEVRADGGQALAAGKVGQPVKWSTSTPEGERSGTLLVKELRARPGTEFGLEKIPRLEAIDGLRDALRLAEKGRKTGIIRMSLVGPDPGLLVATLDALAEAYRRHDVERRSDEAQQTLNFLDSQIPTLREELLAAEAALENYRTQEGVGGVDVSASVKATLERTVEMEKRLSEMKLQRKEQLIRFSASHPAVRATEQKIAQLQGERATLNALIRQLPEAESVSLRLLRDVKVANELYVTLLNKAQELKVMKSGLVGNAHVVDPAVRPTSPVSPNRTRSAAIALASGLFVGLALAIGRKALHQGLQDPADAERATGLPVRVSVPHSARQVALARQRKAGAGAGAQVLAAVDPTDVASEAMRSLRTSLEFALLEAPSNVIAVGSPRPGVGKSFVTVNLGQVFADAGKRVLVVDADLRRGSLHEVLGMDPAPGLSEAIAGAAPGAGLPRKTSLPGIDFVSRGAVPPNPSELLGSGSFQRLVKELSGAYDLVLVDLPPILAVTDAALVGRVAGVNLLVLRSGWHPVRELQLAVKAYAENGVRLSGLVFNEVPPGKGGLGGDAFRYSYRYSYKPGAS